MVDEQDALGDFAFDPEDEDSACDSAHEPAKITAPVPPDVIDRPRLYRVLDKATQRPLVWVSGPAGSGKTTVVSRYLAKKGAAILWYSVDAADEDPASLFHFLRTASARAVTGSSISKLSTFGPEHKPGLALFTRQFFREMFAALEAPFFLVFDNVQDVPETAPFFDLLATGLSEIPPGGHVFLVSRSDPPPAFSRFRASRQLTIVTWNDLRFEPDEAANLLKLLTGKTPEAGYLATLLETIQGWAAGLILLADGEMEAESANLLADSARVDLVFDYFAAEILAKTEASQREFLLKTSFLPTVTPVTGEHLTGNSKAADILSSLCRRNYFTVQRPRTVIYEYHPLFRQFLQRRAAADYSSEALAQLKSAAITILVEVNALDEAVALIRELGDWTLLKELLQEQAPRFLVEARHDTLKRWLGPLPRNVLDQQPWLDYWLAAARTLSEPEEAHVALKHAYRQFRRQNDAVGAFMAWATAAEFLSHFFQYAEVLDYWIDEFDDLITAHPDYPSEQIEGFIATSMLAALAYRQPWHPDLEAWADRAEVLANRANDRVRQLRIDAQRFHALILSPHHFKRIVLRSKFASLLDDPTASEFDRLMAKLGFVADFSYAGQHRDCMEMASRALDLSERSGIVMFTPLFMYLMAISCLNAGEFRKAGEILDAMRPAAEAGNDVGRMYYFIVRAYQEFYRKNSPSALEEAAISLSHIGTRGESIAHVMVKFITAQILSDLGRFDEATGMLQTLKEASSKSGNPFLRMHGCLCEAQILLSQGHEEAAREILAEGLILARNIDLAYQFAWRPDVLGRLCAFALSHDLEVETVQNIIRQRQLRPGCDWHHLKKWTRPIEIYTLGGFSVLKNGEPLKLSQRAPQKPLDLLAALIGFGGNRVSVESICDALWPDAEGPAAQAAFDTTLHRLRRLLGVEETLLLREKRLTLSLDLCWVDVFALQRIIKTVNSKLRSGMPQHDESIQKMLAEIEELSRGDFLAGVSAQPWIEPTRTKIVRSQDRLRNKLRQ